MRKPYIISFSTLKKRQTAFTNSHSHGIDFHCWRTLCIHDPQRHGRKTSLCFFFSIGRAVAAKAGLDHLILCKLPWNLVESAQSLVCLKESVVWCLLFSHCFSLSYWFHLVFVWGGWRGQRQQRQSLLAHIQHLFFNLVFWIWQLL